MEVEGSARFSESSKKGDDLFLQSTRKVKRKSHGEEMLDMEVDDGKDEGMVHEPYKNKLLSNGSVTPFSSFDGRCFGKPDNEIPPFPISKEDMERF